MDAGTEFLRLGHYLWQLHEYQDHYSAKTRPTPESMAILKAEIEKHHTELDTYIIKNKIIPPLNTFKSQDNKPDMLNILSFMGYAMTQPHYYILQNAISKVLASLEDDVVGSVLRIQRTINELLERGHLIFVREEDGGLALSKDNQILVSRNRLYVFGATKEEIDRKLAKRKSSRDKKTEPVLKSIYRNRFSLRF